jgi:hypothetical protein
MKLKQLLRMPDGIEYVRGSSRFDDGSNERRTDFTNANGQRFMRVVGHDTDIWLMLVPAWYECWPQRFASFIRATFSQPK